MIRLQCVCGRKIAAPDQWLGKRVKCPQCGKPVLVVAAEGAPRPAARSETATPHAEPVGSSAQMEQASIGQTTAPAPEVAEDRPVAAAPPPPPPATIEEPKEEFHAQDEPSPSIAAPESDAVQTPTREPEPLAEPATADAVPRSASGLAPVPPPTEGDDEDDFYMKQKRLPRLLGTLGLLVAIGAGASCWSPELDAWTLYIALAGVALSTMGFGLSMSRYRLGLAMPVIGLIASLAALAFPRMLPLFGKYAPAHYVEQADMERQQKAESEAEAQRRGLLSVESLRLTGSKDSLAPEVAYKLINRSGKTIKQIAGSIQLTDRDHRPLGGLGLNLMGPFGPNAVIDGKNVWTMEDATQSAIADNHFVAEYRADQVTYTDGTVKNYGRQ